MVDQGGEPDPHNLYKNRSETKLLIPSQVSRVILAAFPPASMMYIKLEPEQSMFSLYRVLTVLAVYILRSRHRGPSGWS